VKLLCRFVHLPKLLTVAGHQHRNCSRRLGKMEQRPVHFVLSVRERGEMFAMRRLLFHFLPQGLNRVEVGRVSWQLCHRQPLGVRLDKHVQRRARVITGSILHHDHMVGRLGQDIEQKCLVAR
jgi:hypothetical protein